MTQLSLPIARTDVVGRQKVTLHQNIYDADFEYGPQPLRWEILTAGSGTVTHLPGEGGAHIICQEAMS